MATALVFRFVVKTLFPMELDCDGYMAMYHVIAGAAACSYAEL